MSPAKPASAVLPAPAIDWAKASADAQIDYLETCTPPIIEVTSASRPSITSLIEPSSSEPLTWPSRSSIMPPSVPSSTIKRTKFGTDAARLLDMARTRCMTNSLACQTRSTCLVLCTPDANVVGLG